MQCPVCDADTRVMRSRLHQEGKLVVRHRICKDNPAHSFHTREVQTGRLTWSEVLVRQFSGQLVPFDRGLLLHDLRVGVMRRLSQDESSVLINDMLRAMEFELAVITTPLEDVDRAAHPGAKAAIADVAIGRSVARRLLAARDKMAYILYSMSILGREDRSHPQPLRNATDILVWLYRKENFTELVTPIVTAPPRAVRTWYPEVPMTRPRTVIKRTTSPEPFNRHQFVANIRRGMVGRESAPVRARLVAEYVIARLHGQDTVHSHQLAVGVLDALRGHDDIAYLRWAVIYKGINSVTQFRDEALNLLNHPSPILRFEQFPRTK